MLKHAHPSVMKCSLVLVSVEGSKFVMAGKNIICGGRAVEPFDGLIDFARSRWNRPACRYTWSTVGSTH